MAGKELGRKYISRMEGRPMRGWKVAVPVKGKQVQRYFGDTAFGGARKAYAAAKEFRDKLIKQHQLEVTPANAPRFNLSHTRNASGTIGVNLDIDTRGPTLRVSWTAQVMVNGKQTNRAWSVRKYGYLGAFKLAAAHRSSFTKKKAKRAPPVPEWLVEWAHSLSDEERGRILRGT